MIFKINYDSHYSNSFIYKLFHLLNFKNRMEYFVKFDRDALYTDTTSHKFDVNKLFGFSIGYHHNNSHRFGWNVIDGQIHIQAYSYIDKKRVIEDVCIIEPDKEYKFIISLKGSKAIFTIIDGNYEIKQIVIPTTPKKVWGYKLWPYFGGTKVAPQTIHISLFSN